MRGNRFSEAPFFLKEDEMVYVPGRRTRDGTYVPPRMVSKQADVEEFVEEVDVEIETGHLCVNQALSF